MHTLPLLFKEQIINQKGEAYYSQLEKCILTSESPTSIRIQKEIKDDLTTLFEIDTIIPWENKGYYLTSRPAFSQDPLWHAGIYYVQEASSMILGYLLKNCTSNFKNLKVLDLCAAPGGKSTQLLSLLDENSILIANEILPKRAQILKENIIKSGYSNVFVTNNDASDFLGLQATFDWVLIDAPCSGEGLFRKDKDAINEWSYENVLNCSKRQLEIFEHAIHLVKENGLLIYSTCTYNRQENIEQVNYLINTGLFESIPIEIPANFQFETIIENNAYAYQANPSLTKGEGFFISILRKTAFSQSSSIGRENKHASQFIKLDQHKHPILNSFLSTLDLYFTEKNQSIYAWKPDYSVFIKEILNKLKVISVPTLIGELKKDIFIPSHELAVNRELIRKDFANKLIIDKINAVKFLKKEPIEVSYLPEIEKSMWFIVVYLGVNLGWLKVMPNKKQNNYFPLEWRLRK